MIVECPHCYTRVLPSAEGICPACRKDTSDLTGADRDRTAFSVQVGARLPDFCCDCGSTTSRRVTIKHRTKPDDQAEPPAWLSLLAVLTLGIVAPAGRAAGQEADELIIHMPQCESCAARGEPRLLSMNLANRRMTFIVHREFKRKVTEAGGASSNAT